MFLRTTFQWMPLALVVGLSGCTSMGFPSGPKPGTVGFYEVTPSPGRVATQEVRARKVSGPADKVFVYRVNDDMVVLGLGATSSSTSTSGSSSTASAAKVKSFDEVSRGVVISPDSAKKLAAFLDKVAAQYDDKAKKSSVYLDFRITASMAALGLNPAGSFLGGGDRLDPTKEDAIELRLQYVYHLTGAEVPESTTIFLGGKPEAVTYNDLKVLGSNLAKP